ncbi:hypothetical protein SNEBB_002625, partial [Seison nebaliae]
MLSQIYLFADGTCDRAPQNFFQIYSIVLVVNGKYIVLAFIFMKGKSEERYFKAFSKLKNLLNIDPENVTMDFELVAINAWKRIFNNCVMHGCFFYLGQAIIPLTTL